MIEIVLLGLSLGLACVVLWWLQAKVESLDDELEERDILNDETANDIASLKRSIIGLSGRVMALERSGRSQVREWLKVEAVQLERKIDQLDATATTYRRRRVVRCIGCGVETVVEYPVHSSKNLCVRMQDDEPLSWRDSCIHYGEYVCQCGTRMSYPMEDLKRGKS